MSKRDEGVTRRLRWAGLLAAVLVLGTGTAAAQAYWQAQKPLSGTVASGAFAISAVWQGAWSSALPLFPGETRDSPVLTVTETGAAGTTLRWRLAPTVTASSSLTTQLYVGGCGSSTIIAAGASYAPPGGFAPGQSVDLCLRVTLKADAPSNIQGTALTPSISVKAVQVTQ
ncbi:hypothetical protein [Microbacterium sp. che218]|uniref:hypothetical protein n=1 Tax=Microbacterium sp. che218 TaxID=3140649 RepID=UPI003365F1A0